MKYVFDAATGRGWIENDNGSIKCFIKDHDKLGMIELDPVDVYRDMFFESSQEPQLITGEVSESGTEALYAELRLKHNISLFKSVFAIFLRYYESGDKTMKRFGLIVSEHLLVREQLLDCVADFVAGQTVAVNHGVVIPDEYPRLKALVQSVQTT